MREPLCCGPAMPINLGEPQVSARSTASSSSWAEVGVMNRLFTRTGRVILVVVLTGLARPAAANDRTPTLPIVLQVPGDADVPLHLVIRAKDEVTRIYRDAGVDVIWSGVTFDSTLPDALRSIGLPVRDSASSFFPALRPTS